jgi:isoleucyl-tRNA synthetase
VRPNLPAVGRRLGTAVPAVRKALDAGDYTLRADGGIEVAGLVLGSDEVLVERLEKQGWSVASSDGVTVALDTYLDEDLRREGRVHELIHQVNSMRRDAGLEITDRIALVLPAADSDLMTHRDWIANETLATSVIVGDRLSLTKAS